MNFDSVGFERDSQDLRQRIVTQVNPAMDYTQESNGYSVTGDGCLKDLTESPYTLTNVAWILAAIAVLYFTDFAAVIVYDENVYRTWLLLGAVFLFLFLCVAVFIIGYVSWYRRISSDDWETLYPTAIPLATAFFVTASFCITVSLWPVWSILTPIILFIMLMGVIVIIAMIP